MRVILSMIVFLTITSILLGVYHWTSFQDTTSDTELDTIEETINVKESGQTLSVEHRLDALEQEQVSINVPNQVQSLACQDEQCLIQDGKLVVESPGIYTLTYEVSKQSIVSTVYYISDWLVQVAPNELDQNSRNIRITLSGEKRGDWHSVRPPVLDSERNNIHYYEWQFENAVEPALIKLEEPMSYQESLNNLVLLSNNPVSQKNLQSLQKTINQSHEQLLIVNPNLEKVITDQLVIVNDVNNSTDVLFESFLQSVSTNIERDQSVIQTLTILYYNHNVDDDRVNALIEGLTNEEQSVLFQELMDLEFNQGSLIDISDQLLSELLDYETHFFNMNDSTDSFIPLFGEETRPIYLKDEQVDYDLKRMGDQLYMRMNDFIKAFDFYGFSIEQRNEWYVDFDEKDHRFYINRYVYTINDTRYQVDETAWFEINEAIYMNLSTLSQVFNRSLEINKEEIRLE